jgi:hypothetical protein
LKDIKRVAQTLSFMSAPRAEKKIHHRAHSAARPQPKTRFSLPIADCRLSIEEVVGQLPPLSISPASAGSIENRQLGAEAGACPLGVLRAPDP